MQIVETIAEHPFITGGAIIGIGVLYLLLHSSGGGQVAASAPTTQAQANPSVQVAGIQAGAALQSQNNALMSQRSTEASDTNKLNLQLQADLQKTTIEANVASSGQQQQYNASALDTQLKYGVAGAQIAAQLEAVRLATAADVATQFNKNQTDQNIATLNANRDVTINATNNDTTRFGISAQQEIENNKTAAALAAQQAATAAGLALGLNNNSTAVTLRTIDAGVANNASNNKTAVDLLTVKTQGDIATTYINTAGNVAASNAAAKAANDAKLLSLLQSGQLNKGGEGGTNQVAAIAALYNQPSIAGAAYGTQAVNDQSNGIGAILSGIGKVASAVLG